MCHPFGVTARRALAAAALLVVLTGCLKIDMTLDVNENASVDGEIIFAVSQELAQLTGRSRDELVEQFQADVMRDAPAGDPTAVPGRRVSGIPPHSR
jgi:hypothetical protein